MSATLTNQTKNSGANALNPVIHGKDVRFADLAPSNPSVTVADLTFNDTYFNDGTLIKNNTFNQFVNQPTNQTKS